MIRFAKVIDIDAMLTLIFATAKDSPFFQQFKPSNFVGTRQMKHILWSDQMTALVDIEGDKLRGLLIAQKATYYGTMTRYYSDVMVLVQPEHRRGDVATGLMAELEKVARTQNIHSILFIETAGISPEGADGLARKSGYTHTGAAYRKVV